QAAIAGEGFAFGWQHVTDQLISQGPVAGESYVQLALQDSNPNLRITGLRVAQQMEVPLLPILQEMAMDSSVQVRREVALALRFDKREAADQIWVQLADQAPEGDRWYLEALGIGADLFAEQRFAAWQTKVGENWQSPQGKALVWRMKTPSALPLLAQLIAQSPSAQETVPYFRAMDFYPAKQRQPHLEQLTTGTHPQQNELTYYAIRGMNKQQVLNSPSIRKQLNDLLASLHGADPTAYLDLIEDLELTTENEGIFQLAMAHPSEPLGNRASTLLRRFDGVDLFAASLYAEDPNEVMAAISSLESVGTDQSIGMLQRVVTDDTKPMHVRKMAIQAMGSGWWGEVRLEEWLISEPEISQELFVAGATRLLGANRGRIRETAFELLDIDQDAEAPDLEALMALNAKPSNGEKTFQAYCSSCHLVNGEGVDYGPNLSEIGSKLSKPALFGSIINPSAGISFGYEGYLIQTKDDQKYLGYLSSQTEDQITLRVAGGTDIRLNRSEIANMEIQDQSLMTPGLHQVMDAQQLADLVAYLESLKKPDVFAME
ncbi:MAG: c-type cytochrome, partial [Bacteroidota bacterium]